MKDLKLNIKEISRCTWSGKYEFAVTLHSTSFEVGKSQYIIDTLTKWFGTCEYYWNNTYLCGVKDLRH